MSWFSSYCSTRKTPTRTTINRTLKAACRSFSPFKLILCFRVALAFYTWLRQKRIRLLEQDSGHNRKLLPSRSQDERTDLDSHRFDYRFLLCRSRVLDLGHFSYGSVYL